MLTLGIDPGLSGAVAALDLPNKRLVTTAIPTFEVNGKRSVDHRALFLWLRNFEHAEMGLVEQVSAMPKQGVVSMFSFGSAYGACQMGLAAIGIPWRRVPPGEWKKALAVPADKDASRMRASQLLPWAAAEWSRKKDHNVAEAALIALYAVNASLTPPEKNK